MGSAFNQVSRFVTGSGFGIQIGSGFNQVSGFVNGSGFGIHIRIQEGKQLRISRLSAVRKIMTVKQSYEALAKQLFDTSRVSRHMNISKWQSKNSEENSVECWYSRHKTDRSVCTANEPPFTGYYSI